MKNLISYSILVLVASTSLAIEHAYSNTAPAKPAATPSKKKSTSKKSKEAVKKIAVGPSPTPAPQIEPSNSAAAPAVEADDVDSIDQPIPRAKIESSDAPGVKLEAGTAPLGEVATEPLVELHEGDEESVAPSAASALSAGSAAVPTATPVSSASPAPAPTEPGVSVDATAPVTSQEELGKNSVSADQSLRWLLNGNTRFVNKTFRADGRSAEDRLRSSTDQKPHAIVLACSESVTPPEIIFDQGIGEITTIRVAGPQLDTSVIASLEQAVRNHDTHLILVLGHTQCSSLEGSPYIGKKQVDPHAKNEVEAALNADGIARDLTSKSAFLKSRVEAKQLTIKSGLYWVDTGKVKLY